MKLTLSSHVSSFAVSDELIEIIQQELTSLAQAKSSLIINFRSPDYCAEKGGYHPTEIRVIGTENGWVFDYITDFSFQGKPPMAELTKEIDFCFGTGEAYHLFIGVISKAEGKNLFKLWQSNFISYYQMGVFEVEVTLG